MSKFSRDFLGIGIFMSFITGNEIFLNTTGNRKIVLKMILRFLIYWDFKIFC